MKIVEITFSLTSGGLERFAVDLSNELSKSNDVTLITLKDDKIDTERRCFYKFDLSERVKYLNLGLGDGFSLESEFKIFNTLSQAGGYRGGFDAPSPIWADRQELIARPLKGLNQIVGHTPVRRIANHTVRNIGNTIFELIFCDTSSTYSDGNPYGDGSFLLVNKESYEFRK